MSRPALTYTGLINGPPGRVAAALAPLRALEPEVVLAVDDRVDAAWIDGYRQLADRVIAVPFPGAFAYLYGWLREQCSGRWILQLDADEVPSARLAAAVAQTIAADDVTHAWAPVRWLYPDAARWLVQWPWRPAYALRLMRNHPTLVRFPAVMHQPVEAIGPRRFLRAPIYHADLLLNDVAARERKCARYERGRPGLVLDGGSLNEAFYLPERRTGLRTAPVPAEDRPSIDAFLAAGTGPAHPGPDRAPAALESATLAEITRRHEGRTLGDSAYRARLRLLDDDPTVVSGEWRTFDVEVCNLGDEHWPGGMTARPQIRVAYRWVEPDGTLQEGMRTGLGAPLAPGAADIVPVEVLGPDTAGAREIEIDLVHEHVRWFGCGVRARVDVRAPTGPL